MAGKSLNRVVILGNLTRDPELKYTPNGTAVCTFGVATNRTWTTATGETKESVQFHRIVAWQKLAELCGKLMAKGRKVYLEGHLTYRTYVGKDGIQRSITEIVADDFILFDDRFHREASEEAAPADIEDTVLEEKAATDSPVEEKAEPKKAVKKTAAEKQETESTASEPVDSDVVDPDDIPF